MSEENQEKRVRFDYMDSARAFCLLCGIPYHASLIYAPMTWRINSPDVDQFVTLIGRFTAIFRMSAFFIIAGFFAALIVSRRGPRDWLKSRAVRLWVPFVVGIAYSLPITLQTNDEGSTVNFVAHLWFLATLFWISCIYVALRPIVAPVRLATWPAIFASTVIFVIWQIATELWLKPIASPYETGLINTAKLFQYLPFFLLGALLFEHKDMRDRFLRLDAWAVILAALPIAGFLLLRLPPIGTEAIKAVAALSLSRLVLAIMATYFDRPSKLVRRTADLSFSIYVLHLPFIVLLGMLLLEISLHPWIEFGLICAATLALCWVGAETIERSAFAKFLFNGTRAPPAVPTVNHMR